MAYYQITVELKDKTIHQSIPELEINDIDHAWLLLYGRSRKPTATAILTTTNVVLLSSHSQEVKIYLSKKAEKKSLSSINYHA